MPPGPDLARPRPARARSASGCCGSDESGSTLVSNLLTTTRPVMNTAIMAMSSASTAVVTCFWPLRTNRTFRMTATLVTARSHTRELPRRTAQDTAPAAARCGSRAAGFAGLATTLAVRGPVAAQWDHGPHQDRARRRTRARDPPARAAPGRDARGPGHGPRAAAQPGVLGRAVRRRAGLVGQPQPAAGPLRR